MVEALVEHDYIANEVDELTIRKGDIITDIDVRSGGWWKGTLARVGKRGMFPDNFVKLIRDSNTVKETKSDVVHQSSSGRRCKVLFNYKPVNEDELELCFGDVIEILGEEEEGWWKGKLRDQIGVFPSNFVAEIMEPSEIKDLSYRKTKTTHEEIFKQSGLSISSNSLQNNPNTSTSNDELSEAPVLPPKPTKEICRVLFPYEAANDDELTLQDGDLITLITKEGQDVGWWKGELKGKVGVFPDNFVVLVPNEELTKPDRPSKVHTTNRIRDSITKPVSNIASSGTTSSSVKKIIETQKQEEKVSPPSVSKKPSLPPPPQKKLLRSPNGNDITKSATSPSLAIKLPDSPTSGLSFKIPFMSPNMTTTVQSITQLMSKTETSSSTTMSSNKWTVIEGDNPDGALVSKQTYSVTSGSSSSNMTVSSTNSTSTDLDLDLVSRAAMLTHPTASRVKAPRRRLPSAMLAKEDSKDSEEPEGLLNGSAEIPPEKPTSLPTTLIDELKLNQAKKQAGKTRVIIGGSQPPESILPSELPSANKTVVSNVSLRSKPPAGQRPMSMFGLSKISSIGSGNAADEAISITVKQWNEINDKVAKLESLFESQSGVIEFLTTTIKELTEKLEDESQKRQLMEQELEKITGVTV